MALSDATYRRDLGDGLLLRWSRAADSDRLAAFFSQVFREEPGHPPNPFMSAWIRQMSSGENPLTNADTFPLVEDTRSGLIAAASGLLSATWSYDDIPFTVGRPEPVATHPDYRNRGLVRAIFELLHARSAARGDKVQAITGIPYFYRQFGYEYALEMSAPRLVYFNAIPQLKPGTPEPYGLREATVEELPLVMALHEHELRTAHGGQPVLVRAHFDADYWRFMVEGADPQSGIGWQPLLISSADGRPVGYVLRQRTRWSSMLNISGIMTEQGISLAGVLPSVLRGLRDQVDHVMVFRHDTPPASHIRFGLAQGHVVHKLLSDTLASPQQLAYAWYVRVPELPRFLLHIGPALERRLAHSAAAGYSGDLRLTFYQGGLRLTFESGRLTGAEHWREPEWEPKPHAGFPPLVFLQLVFGYRSLAELRHALVDVWANDEGRVLLEALFPPQPSWVLAQD